jgi:hypothetical protein
MADITLNGAVADVVAAFMDGIHTAIPGIIKAYYPLKKTADVQCAIYIYDDDGLPLAPVTIFDCPVLFPGTDRAILHFPLTMGDACLLIFSERSLEGWMKSGGGICDDGGDPRKFSLTDGFCIPGGFNASNPGKMTAGNGLELLYDELKILLNNDGSIDIQGSAAGEIKITAAGHVEVNGNTKSFVTGDELNTALQTFMTALMLHVHTCTAPGSPSSPPTSPMTLDITTAKTLTVKTGG